MAVNINQIETQLNRFLELDISKGLIRRDDLGAELCFQDLSSYVEPLKKLFSRIKKEIDWNIASNQTATKFQTDLNNLNARIDEIQKFNANQGNIQQRNSIISNFTNAYNGLSDAGSVLITQNSVINPAFDSAEETIRTLEQKLNDQLSKAEGIVNKIEKVSGEAGVSKYSKSFADISDDYKKAANIWLAVSIGSIVLLIGGGIYILEKYGDATETAEIINNTISKIILLTGLIYFVTLSIRNYKANRHNQIVNKHKATALNTFKVFVDAADEHDPQTQNAILLEATKTIFGSVNTGFLSGNTDSADLSPKVIEIFKGIGSKPQ